MTNDYRFEFRHYRRRFVRSLTTNHGNWDIREGIIVRLIDQSGKVGWGEIAPISWFGSETLEQALDFCRQLPTEITDEIILSIPDELPACQFGFESALEGVGSGDCFQTRRSPLTPLKKGGKETLKAPLFKGGWGDLQRLRCFKKGLKTRPRDWGLETGGDKENNFITPNSSLLTLNSSLFFYSALLPAGEAALNQWETLWQQGYRTFKWKIGVYAIAHELKIFESLIHTLPSSTKLRLGANGGLSYEEANLWLWTCDNLKANREPTLEIEFIEQPLGVEQFQQMLELSTSYETAIALDESVATLGQLAACYQQGWRGIFVIKPGIVGSPSRLRKFCQQHQIDTVFSSVFETAIARLAALQLAAELSRNNRAVGFGIDHFFEQDETCFQNLWNNL